MKKRLLCIILVICLIVPSVFVLASCKKEGKGVYTYRVATSSLPTNWNVHTYQSNDATTILDYTEDGFYSFDYNDTKDGYKWVLAMATAFPQDVTDEYRNDAKWGIGANDTWKAIRVTFRDDLYFDNGEHITSKDFLDSIQLLLNPAAANYRADSLYGGQFSIVNAENFTKGGSLGYTSIIPASYPDAAYYANNSFTVGTNGVLSVEGKGTVVLDMNSGSTWGDHGIADYESYFSKSETKTLADGTVCLQYEVVTKIDANGKATEKTVLILREKDARPITTEAGLAQWGYYDDTNKDGKDEFIAEILENLSGDVVLDNGLVQIKTFDEETGTWKDTLRRSVKGSYDIMDIGSEKGFALVNALGERTLRVDAANTGMKFWTYDGTKELSLVLVDENGEITEDMEEAVAYAIADGDTVVEYYDDIELWYDYSWFETDGVTPVTKTPVTATVDGHKFLVGWKFVKSDGSDVKNAAGETTWEDEDLIAITNQWTDTAGKHVELVPEWNSAHTEVMGWKWIRDDGSRVDFKSNVERLDHPFQWYDKDGNKVTRKEIEVDGSKVTVFEKADGTYVQKTVNNNGTSTTSNVTTKDLAAVVTYNEHYKALLDAANKEGIVEMTAALAEHLTYLIAYLNYGQSQGRWVTPDEYAEYRGNYVGANGDIPYGLVEWQEFCFFAREFDELDFSEVGVQAHGDYALDFIIEESLRGFYLTYNLAGSMYLVNTKVYKANIGESQGAYTNSYGTSVDTYVGFGPYKLTEFVSGNVARFARNEHWYGYKDAEKSSVPLYQTTNIQITQVTDANTRLNMFLTGQTDSYGLQASEIADYAAGDFTYYTDGDSTFFVALNPDMDGLTYAQKTARAATAGNEVNKTVLTIKEFRMALSFAIDRAAYINRLDPASSVAKALYSKMIISNPDTSEFYRETEEAKDAVLAFWGLTDEVGPGKTYATKDEAIASITGYDPDGAKELFREAFEIAKEQKLISASAITSGKWEVQIVIGQPGNGGVAYYNNGYELLRQVWTEAVKDTPFEGHLVFSQSQPLGSTSFSDYLKNNQVDVLFGVGWTGSTLDPYNLMEAYVSPNYQYDPGWDTKKTTLDIVINGETLRATVYDWGYTALQGKVVSAVVVGADGKATSQVREISAGTEADMSLRLKILAAVEQAILEQYDMIPVQTDASATLKGMRIKYYTEEYIFGMGRGGIKYMTYTMDDAQWAKFVKKAGGTLNYK